MKRLSQHAVFILLLLLAFQQTRVIAQEKKAKVICIAFYNLDNLFDTIRDPRINDEEFTPKGESKWDSKRYYLKLSHLADVISQIGDEYSKNGPAFIGVSEVENRQVVEDLAHTPPLKSMGYDIVHFDSPDKRGIDVALLYQPKLFKVKSTKTHRLTMPDDTGFRTRDILQVDGYLDGELMHVLVNHWPSRTNGQQESAPKRNAAADLCLSAVKAIYQEEPNARVIIMGDMNDDPVDESLIKHLKIVTKPENVKPGDLFDPMWQMFHDGNGTLAYRDNWDLFDQIIVSSSLMNNNSGGYRYLKAKVFKKSFIVQKEGPYAGYPFRTYGGGVYLGGYSDHFPVYMFLVKELK